MGPLLHHRQATGVRNISRLSIATRTLFLASLKKESKGAVQSVQTLQTSALNSFDGGRCQGGLLLLRRSHSQTHTSTQGQDVFCHYIDMSHATSHVRSPKIRNERKIKDADPIVLRPTEYHMESRLLRLRTAQNYVLFRKASLQHGAHAWK